MRYSSFKVHGMWKMRATDDRPKIRSKLYVLYWSNVTLTGFISQVIHTTCIVGWYILINAPGVIIWLI